MSYAINTNDGRISIWVQGVSNCCYHPIPDDVAKGVSDGTIRWEDVVNAINKKRYMDKNFDWTGLREAEKQLNVRTAKFEFADAGKPEESTDASSERNAITMSDVIAEASGTTAVTPGMVEGKKTTARAKRSAKANAPDIFDDGVPETAV